MDQSPARNRKHVRNEHSTQGLTPAKPSPAADIAVRVSELADVLGIEPLLGRSVAGLSGGESQRVALGRALSFHPAVLLLDEPLSALDEATRHEMHEVLKKVKEASCVTTLHVTHSVEDADALADRRLTLVDGRISE